MNFEQIKEQILLCQDCKAKFGFTPVPIVHGTAHSKIVHIGQAPSSNAHLTRKPFNDPSGAKLKYKWYQVTDEVFYDEDNFYFTALAHCFPGKSKGGGDRLPPLACARKWLTKELELVDNQLYVIIGAKAAGFLFPNESFEDLVFHTHQLNNKPAVVLPHPSPLNIKWFKDHPEFEEQRLAELRDIIWQVLGLTSAPM